MQPRRHWQWFCSRPAKIGAALGVFLAFATPGLAWAQDTAIQVRAANPKEPSTIDNVLILLAGLIDHVAAFLASLMSILLGTVIKVMQYNGFVDSPVVSAGWAIVRDTVNMFFVVVLVVIAVGTIFGSSRFQWQQQVPRLLLFAIVINFSKTICGIIIDIGQVVMLTFANALQAVAAGNFVQMFGIQGSQFTNTSAIYSVDLFFAAVAHVIMNLWVLVTVMILLAILVIRIVALWILVTIAPLTWFVGGIQGLTHSDAYADWWKKFNCYVVSGPLLTFFLWLTLAVLGAGNVAASKGFEAFSAPRLPGEELPIKLAIFEPVHLMTFVIGMGMLYAGFQAAADFCHGASGVIGGMLHKGQGAGGVMARFAGGLGAKGLGKGAGAVARGGKYVAGAAASRIDTSQFMQGRRMDALKKQEAKAKGIEDPLKRAKAMEKVSAQQAKVAEAAKKVGKPFEGMGEDAKIAGLVAAGQSVKSGKKLDSRQKQQMQAVFAEMASNKDARKALDQAGVFGNLYEELGGKEMTDLFKGDKAMNDSLKDLQATRPDVTGDFSKITDVESLRKLDPKAWAALSGNKGFKDRIADIDSGDVWKDGPDKGKPVKVPDYIAAGRMGGRVKDAYEGGLGGLYAKMSKEELKKESPLNVTAALQQMNPDQAAGFAEKNAESFATAIKADPLVIGRMKPEARERIKADALPHLDDNAMASVVRGFKQAGPDGQKAMLPDIDNIRSMLNDNLQTGKLAALEEQLKESGWQETALTSAFASANPPDLVTAAAPAAATPPPTDAREAEREVQRRANDLLLRYNDARIKLEKLNQKPGFQQTGDERLAMKGFQEQMSRLEKDINEIGGEYASRLAASKTPKPPTGTV
ncbi:hypothetical protein EPO34_02475 [Patescibacteria group bacterium]|nr:MAG: hypothetical protein EPO34_02475 [Patescibacteria group bacterium]